jgi:hypothetical protein
VSKKGIEVLSTLSENTQLGFEGIKVDEEVA